MTNAIILSVVLQTNWSGFVQISDGLATESAKVQHVTMAHYMDGTNKVWCGLMLPVEVGIIYRTNSVAGNVIIK